VHYFNAQLSQWSFALAGIVFDFVRMSVEYILTVESDPTSPKYMTTTVSSLDTSPEHSWVQQALKHYPVCGCCLERPSSAFEFSQPWATIFGPLTLMIMVSVSCANDDCRQLSRLRAANYRRCSLTMSQRGIFTTPTSVCKACAYCGMRRELVASKVCGKCRGVHYCNAQCQTKHWRVHKSRCGVSDNEVD